MHRVHLPKARPQQRERKFRERYRSSDGGRVSVLRDLGGSVEVLTVESLMDRILPPVDIDTTAVAKSLRDKGCIADERWSVFPKDPKTSKKTEQETFKPFESVVRNILQCAEARSKQRPILQFFDNPNRAPTSTRSNDTRPDSYFVRDGGHNRPSPRRSQSQAPLHNWNDIALPAEYKKNVTTKHRDDNFRKIMWSMHHIMRSDPCRRFTYGFTIENTEMRIWFSCRTKLYVTEKFNFIQEHERLVRFVIVCSYAKEEDLGWDPSIKRIYVGETAQYDINVDDGAGQTLVFRTTNVLYDFGADGLRGRGTRVFEARKLNKGSPSGASVALKDVWVDDDRSKEGDIRKIIEADVTSDEDKAIVQKHFLTVLYHGTVMINGRVDNTRKLILRGHDLPVVSQLSLNLQEGPATCRESSIDAIPLRSSMARPQHTNILYSHKDHYRIVFKEVAQPVHNMIRLDDILQALMGATKGLELMHRYGWVHRDISPGNVLVYEGVGKLTDLEYTKNMTVEGSHLEVRTGTLNYISLEAAQCRYLFRTPVDDTDPMGSSARAVISVPWRYNPLHDLESLWWICVRMMLFHRTEADDQEKDLVWKQYKVHQSIFPGSLSSEARTTAFMSYGTLIELLLKIPIQTAFEPVAGQLELMRRQLVNRYQIAEKGTEIDMAAFTGIHQYFFKAFETARTSSGDTKLCSLADIIPGTKRGREDEEEDEEENHGGRSKMGRADEQP